MIRYGLIGRTLGHSYSQRWFESLFARCGRHDVCYGLYPMESLDGLRGWVRQEGIAGFNVTLPYKERVMPLLDAVDDTARAIGAVNCVSVEHGRLTGYNTDAPAFAETLRPHLRPCHTRALVLGTGGASRAVCHALREMGIEATPVSRTPERHAGAVGYAEAATLMESHLLVVNTTPVGMHPDDGGCPWSYADGWTPRHIAYDLVYNPSPTRFMLQAESKQATAVGGLAMLYRQAELSWQLWAGARGAAPGSSSRD